MPKKETLEQYKQIFALGVSNPNMQRAATAVLILPGGGKGIAPTRLIEPQWQLYTDDLWVAGTRGDPVYTREDIVGYIARDGKLPERLQIQPFALHTQEQMNWAVDMLLEDWSISHLIISTAKYHIPRCVLTFVKAWIKLGDSSKLSIGILPTSDMGMSILRTSSSTSQTLDQELERMEEYQVKGIVATSAEFQEFLLKNS